LLASVRLEVPSRRLSGNDYQIEVDKQKIGIW
jgi:hypothetical protein